MGDAVEDERFGGLLEANTLVESFGIRLCLDDDKLCLEMLYRGLYGGLHDLLAVAASSLGGDYTADRHLSHVRAGRTYAAECHHFVAFGEPQVYRCLVVAVKVLIHAVLLHHEHLAAHAEQLVEFVNVELGIEFLVQLKFHDGSIAY